jgi:hypothetical protein
MLIIDINKTEKPNPHQEDWTKMLSKMSINDHVADIPRFFLSAKHKKFEKNTSQTYYQCERLR